MYDKTSARTLRVHIYEVKPERASRVFLQRNQIDTDK